MIQKLLLIWSINLFDYAENLKPINHIHNKTNTKDLLQSHKGKLLWMSSQTRPEIASHVCQLGTNFKNSGEQDVKYANKVITHLKQDPAQIIYKQVFYDDSSINLLQLVIKLPLGEDPKMDSFLSIYWYQSSVNISIFHKVFK